MWALCPVPNIGELGKVCIIYERPGHWQKARKREFNACGMFILPLIVENLGSSEIFKAAAKSLPPGFRCFTRPISLPQLPQKHPVNSHLLNFFFGPGPVLGTEGTALTLRPCPALQDSDRARGGKTTENVLPQTVKLSPKTTPKNKCL